MNFYNKTTLLPSLDELYRFFIQPDGRIIRTDCFFCIGPRIVIEHKQTDTKHSIRIWKTVSLFNYWYGGLTSPGSKFVAALDYTIQDDKVKVDHIGINDGDHGNMYEEPLDHFDAQELNDSLIHFLEIVAKTNYLPKIVIDVHKNLKIYNKYYKNNGFKLTEPKCTAGNPNWIETEKYV